MKHDEGRVRAALKGPYGEVLRVIALQPRYNGLKELDGECVPVPRGVR